MSGDQSSPDFQPLPLSFSSGDPCPLTFSPQAHSLQQTPLVHAVAFHAFGHHPKPHQSSVSPDKVSEELASPELDTSSSGSSKTAPRGKQRIQAWWIGGSIRRFVSHHFKILKVDP